MNFVEDLMNYLTKMKEQEHKNCEINFATPHFSYWKGREEVWEEVIDFINEFEV